MSIVVNEAITINRPASELFRYWRNFENLPTIMEHLKEVTCLDPMTSHWVVKAPLGTSVEWDARVVDERQNHSISWASVQDADVRNAGSVQFDEVPDGRGTVVRVHLEYDPPGGAVGAFFAKLFGEEPHQQIREDLRHFKERMETGQILTTTSEKPLKTSDRYSA